MEALEPLSHGQGAFDVNRFFEVKGHHPLGPGNRQTCSRSHKISASPVS